MFQGQIDAAVKILLSLKADYKAATGQDWKPGCTPPAPAAPASQASSGGDAVAINQHIVEQGNAVRQLKSEKAGKVCTTVN